MIRLALPIVALTLTACGKSADDTADTSDSTCGVEVRATYPSADSSDFYYRGFIEFQLSQPDETAVLSIDGVTGVSTLNSRMDTVYFTPDENLSPSTTYTATLDYCSGSPSIEFTTSPLGAALEGGVDITQQTYRLDLQSGRVVIPEGVGAVLQDYLDFQILIQPTSVENDTITMVGAMASEVDNNFQDYCDPTIDFPVADFSNAPYFQIGPQSTTIAVSDYSVTIENLLISGTISQDGTWFGGGSLAGEIDTRPLVPLLFEGEDDENAICDFILGFGVSCIPCYGDESLPYCLEIEAIELEAEGTTGPSVEFIEQEDCHEECAASDLNDECVL